AAHRADLGEEAVEERDVACLVGDLRREEDPRVLAGRGPHHRSELAGDALLAEEEPAQPHALGAATVAREALVPVDAVLREVEVGDAPLLALPEVEELAI